MPAARTTDSLAELHRRIRRDQPALAQVPRGRAIRAWRLQLLQRLRQTWCVEPVDRQPPAARVLATAQRSGYRLQRLELRARGGVPIPALLLVPDEPRRRSVPAALCLHGNVPGAKAEVAGELRSAAARRGFHAFDDDYARRLARAGVMALIIDQPLQGERAPADALTGAFDAGILASLMFDRSYLGWCLADQQQALNYLLSRPDVDHRRVGAIGFSMGGTLAAALAAVDQRVRHVLFSGYVFSMQARLASGRTPSPLLNYVPAMLRWFDYPHVLAAVAPTPMTVIAEARGRYPAERRWMQPIRDAYRAWGVEDRLRIWRAPVAPHRFHPDPCLSLWIDELCR